jgi:hypothetical protein
LARERERSELRNLREILAVVPHVLMDRVKLRKDPPKLLAVSLRCLTSLWLVFDKGFSDTGKWDIAHILVESHLATSYIVGKWDLLFGLLSKMATVGDEMTRAAVWECVRSADPLISSDIKSEPIE